MIGFTKEDLKNKNLIRFAIMFTTTSSCCIATRRLRNNIRIIELDSLPVVFAGVEVHLGLDLEHEVP